MEARGRSRAYPSKASRWGHFSSWELAPTTPTTSSPTSIGASSEATGCSVHGSITTTRAPSTPSTATWDHRARARPPLPHRLQFHSRERVRHAAADRSSGPEGGNEHIVDLRSAWKAFYTLGIRDSDWRRIPYAYPSVRGGRADRIRLLRSSGLEARVPQPRVRPDARGRRFLGREDRGSILR